MRSLCHNYRIQPERKQDTGECRDRDRREEKEKIVELGKGGGEESSERGWWESEGETGGKP